MNMILLCALYFWALSLVLYSLSSHRPTTKSDLMPRTKYKAQRTKDRSLSKLFEKSHIILEQQTNIIELINSRAGAIDAEAKCKAGEYFRIYVCSAQDIWMHHARAA